MTENEDVNTVELAKSAADLEVTLKSLYQRKRVAIADREIDVIRLKLRSAYATLLQAPATSNSPKDVEQALWKNIYYKAIEDYRHRLRALQSVPPGNTTKLSPELRRLNSSFRSFLQEASGFYSQLIVTLASLHSIREVEPLVRRFGWGELIYDPDGKRESHTYQRMIQTIHKLLIFLGDLTRYKELNAVAIRPGKAPNWTTAIEYYNAAKEIAPDSGNPWNQLAVIATYRASGSNGDWEGVYYYYRSLVLKNPFLTARENLAVLFQKSIKRFDNAASLANAENLSQTSNQILNEKSEEKKGRSSKLARIAREKPRINDEESAKLEKWLTNFVRIHAAIFLKDGLEILPTLKLHLLEQLPSLLFTGSIHSEILLRTTIINQSALFVLRRSGSSKDKSSVTTEKAMWEREALAFALEFFLILLESVEMAFRESELPILGSSSYPLPVAEVIPASVKSVLPAIRISMKWLCLVVDEIDKIDSTITNRLWKCLEGVLTFLGHVMKSTEICNTKKEEDIIPKEDIELRGFLVLKAEFGPRAWSTPNSPIRSSMNPNKELERRVKDIVKDGTVAMELRQVQIKNKGLMCSGNWRPTPANGLAAKEELRAELDADLDLDEALRSAQIDLGEDDDSFIEDEEVVYQALPHNIIPSPIISHQSQHSQKQQQQPLQPQQQQTKSSSVHDMGKAVGSGRPNVSPSQTFSSGSNKSTSGITAEELVEQVLSGGRKTSHSSDDSNFYTLFDGNGSASVGNSSTALFGNTKSTPGLDIWERGDSLRPYNATTGQGLSTNGTSTMLSGGRIYDFSDLARPRQDHPGAIWPQDPIQTINNPNWHPHAQTMSTPNHFNPPPGFVTPFHQVISPSKPSATNSFPPGFPSGFASVYNNSYEKSPTASNFEYGSSQTTEYPDNSNTLLSFSRRSSYPLPEPTHEALWSSPGMNLNRMTTSISSTSSSGTPSTARFLVNGGNGIWSSENGS